MLDPELHVRPATLRVMAKAGPLRNGSERGGGSIWHWVPGEPHDNRKALCGAQASIQWSSHTPEGQQPTCKKCIRLNNVTTYR